MFVTPLVVAIAVLSAAFLIAAVILVVREKLDWDEAMLLVAVAVGAAAIALFLAFTTSWVTPKSATDALDARIPVSDVKKLGGLDDPRYKSSTTVDGLSGVTYVDGYEHVFVTCDEHVPDYRSYPQKTKWNRDAAFEKDVTAIPEDVRCHVGGTSLDDLLSSTVELVAESALRDGVHDAIKEASNATTLDAPDVSKFDDSSTTWIVDTIPVSCTGTLPTVDDLGDYLDENLPRIWSTRLADEAVAAYDVADKIDVTCEPMIDSGRRSFTVG